ncbi:glycosyltransferase family 4 protein [Rubrolithibacter danxiaensis]|uniref:glycosyltransferase family 4 protein n=1 Tax=Rubrolithibacter danxiaensis TaxID=3390805 RepID=UPI003BF8D2AF
MLKQLRIGIDIRDLKIAKTGAKTFLEEIYLELKNSSSAEYKFFFFQTSLPVYTGRNIFLKLIEQIRFLLWKQITLPVKAWSKKCDVLFCTDYFVPYLRLGYKTIPVFHDAFFWEYPEHYNKYWLLTFRFLGVKAAQKSPFIITPTYYAKQRLLSFINVNPEKIKVIPEAPKTLNCTAQGVLPIQEKLRTGNYILHIGTFEKRKNLARLIEAFYLLRKEGYSDYSLILGGQYSPKSDMDDSANVISIVKKYNLEDYVLLPGYILDNELALFYKNASLYVFPSLNEGFGLPILEAFQQQTPVIIADNTCLPEVGGNAVISFDPYNPQDIMDKMKKVISDPITKADLIAKGNERLKEFSWRKTCKQLLTIFANAHLRK